MRCIYTLLLIVGIFSSVRGQDTATDICPILVGSTLPDGTFRKPDGAETQLSEALNARPAVIIVYRGGWCPYCNKQLAGVAKREQELRDMGYQIIGISPDKPEKLMKTMDKKDIGYQLLSDSKLEWADQIGVGFKVDEKTIKRYKVWGIDLVDASGETHERLPVPTVLLVDKEQTVQFTYTNPNYKVRLEEDVLMAAAKAALKK